MNRKNKILLAVVALIFAGLIATGCSQRDGDGNVGGVEAPSLWKLVNNTAVVPIKDTWTIGSESSPLSYLAADEVCVNGDCRTAWPAGAGGTDAWSTSSDKVYLGTAFTKVGIGTTNPSYALNIAAATTDGFLNIGDNYNVRPNGAIMHTGMITNRTSTYQAIGTSITKGDPNSNSEDYTDLLSSRLGVTITNNGVAYSQCGDMASYVYASSPASTTTFFYESGTNDFIYYTSAGQYPVFRDCYTDAIAWLSIPAGFNKQTARNASITYSGTWSDNGSSYGIGRLTTENGAYATSTIYGKDIMLSVMTVNSNAATADLYVDGVLNQTVSFQGVGAVTTQLGRNYVPKLITIRGLEPTTHEVKLVKTNADGTMYFNWIAGGGSGQGEKNGPRVYAINIARTTESNNDDKIKIFNRMIENSVSTVASMGFNVSVVDIAGIFSNVDNVEMHGVHPTDYGHFRIANALEAAMNEASTQSTKQMTAAAIPNIKWEPSSFKIYTQDTSNSWAERLGITAAGYVGIGTTSPNATLSVEGNINVAAGSNFTIGGTALPIPTSASTTQWDSFYNTPSSRITAGASCAWVGNTFNCSGEGTTYTAGGTLLGLTGAEFSVKEGTLTNNKACTYVTGTGLVCNSDLLALTSFSSSATGIDYTNTTGVFSWASGYEGFTTAKKNKYDAMITASTSLPYLTTVPKSRSFALASSSLATMWPQSSTASSTVCLAPMQWDVTPTDLVCYLNGGSSPTARISVGTTTSIFSNKADVTGSVASTTLSVNNQFSVNEKLCVTIGAVNNSPDSVACYLK